MRYGVPYQGSKNKICKWVIDNLPSGKAVCARAVFEAIQRDARATADRNIAKLTGDAKNEC